MGSTIIKFYSELDELFESKEKSRMRGFFSEWLDRSEKTNDKTLSIAVCNEFGAYLRASGDVEYSKMLYRRTLELLKEVNLDKTEHYATALINAGDVYIVSKEYMQALDYFMRAKALLEECGLGGDYRMAALCNNISAVYTNLDEYDRAEEALNISFNIIKGIPSCEAELATTYINLGDLQYRQGKLELARDSYESALDIFEKNTGLNDVHTSSAYAGLGNVYFKKNDYGIAAEFFRKALFMIERDFGKTDNYFLVENSLRKAVELDRMR